MTETVTSKKVSFTSILVRVLPFVVRRWFLKCSVHRMRLLQINNTSRGMKVYKPAAIHGQTRE
jgi:hypothetical protein